MRNFLPIIIITLLFGCTLNSTPKGIMSAREITPVLVDIHLAEGIFTLRSSLNITRENFHEDLYLSVLKKHKIDQKVFEASVLYYGKHPEKYKQIYDDVVDRLNEMDVRSKAKDSIQNAKLKPVDTAKIKK